MGPPSFWWVMLMLDLLSPGAGGNPVENPPYQVNGMLGGSVLLHLKLPPAKPVSRIEWFFRTRSRANLIAAFKDGKLQQKNINSKFLQRVEIAEETTLWIRALQKGDSGALMAYVLFATGEILKQIFLLSVFEPLSDPQIRAKLTSKMAETCNVTLQCLASSEGSFNISWKRENQLRGLGEDSGWYRVSPEGTDLHLSWQPNSSDSTFTCLLSNPVAQKNVSFDLLSICRDEEASRFLSWVRLALLVGLWVQIVTVAWLNVLRRTWRKEN